MATKTIKRREPVRVWIMKPAWTDRPCPFVEPKCLFSHDDQAVVDDWVRRVWGTAVPSNAIIERWSLDRLDREWAKRDS